MFNLDKKTCVVTGGAGLLGKEHAIALLNCGAKVALLDIDRSSLQDVYDGFDDQQKQNVIILECDITQEESVVRTKDEIKNRFNSIDVLINNAAKNPKVEDNSQKWTRVENFPEEIWDIDLNVGLKGTFLCSKVFGIEMTKQNSGSIINIASDLAIISPDQRLYEKPDTPDTEQMVKPITYSVVKSGLLGMTRYFATYWAKQNIRCNALSLGGVSNGQNEEFVSDLVSRIPLGRMAQKNDYHGAIVLLSSDEGSYINGANIVVDGGRTIW